jgi:hypothetical protein
MTRVARMSASLITDGAFLPSGRMLLRGYGQVYVIDKPSTVADGRLKALASDMLPDQDQGESIAVIDGGKQALVGSEGRREPVLRISVPAVPGDEVEGTTPAKGTSGSKPGNDEASAGGSQTAGSSEHTFTGVGSRRLWKGVIAAGVVVVGLIGAATTIRSRRH